MSILAVSELKKSFSRGFVPRRQEVLKGITFQLAQSGTITGFLGANGAGKTTTMKCMLGLISQDSGEIRFFGGQTLSASVKNRIGYLPERPYFYEYLTGEEFLRLCGKLSRMPSGLLKERMEKLLKRVELWDAREKRLRTYSKGMIQKIGVIQALLHQPELVILDEPMSGLDPDGRYYLRELILETAAQGAAVFFSSHLLPDTEQICKDVVIMKEGRVIYSGGMQELLTNVNSPYEVIASEAGKKVVYSAADAGAVKKLIEGIWTRGGQIQQVHQVRKSLEEVFISLALRGRSS